MPHYVLSRITDTGKKVYMTSHRRTSESFSGYDVGTDPNPRKALLFGNEKSAHERARQLSSEFGTFKVEDYVPAAKVGDAVDDSGEIEVKPKSKSKAAKAEAKTDEDCSDCKEEDNDS